MIYNLKKLKLHTYSPPPFRLLRTTTILFVNTGTQLFIKDDDPCEEIGWLDPRWLDPRPMMYNAAEQAEEFAMNVWHKFQSWKVKFHNFRVNSQRTYL